MKITYKQQSKYKKRNRWTNVKKIETGYNYGF